MRQRHLAFDVDLRAAAAKLAVAGGVLALVLWLVQRPAADMFVSWATWRDESALAVLAAIGGVVYFGIVLALMAALRPLIRRTSEVGEVHVPARNTRLSGSA